MDVKAFVIHRLIKKQGDDSKIIKKPRLLTVDKNVTGFVKEAEEVYYKKTAKDYGVFNKDKDGKSILPFESFLKRYSQGNINFLNFSYESIDYFKTLIDKETLATGGYVAFAHFCLEEEYIMVAMLNDKVAYAIDQDLNINKKMHVALDELDVANFVNGLLSIVVDEKNDYSSCTAC